VFSLFYFPLRLVQSDSFCNFFLVDHINVEGEKKGKRREQVMWVEATRKAMIVFF
jgi:hypothetical protein